MADADRASEFSSIMLLNDHQWNYLQTKYNMTKREMQIAKLVCRGLGNEDIARSLSIRHGTVKTHIRNLYRKLWVHNKISMLLRFIQDASIFFSNPDSPLQMLIDTKQTNDDELVNETQCQEVFQ
ncbi:MAG: helix-turn-helix transcriptional regulator [Phycisphaerae bacterium]|nr:helix-turn-helix transcriptional regulator [Phycisphaerae bacterium]